MGNNWNEILARPWFHYFLRSWVCLLVLKKYNRAKYNNEGVFRKLTNQNDDIFEALLD